MLIQNSERNHETHRNISRRELLKESLAFAVLTSGFRPLPGSARGENQRIFAYVGTYSDPGASGGNGKGIYLFEMSPATGDLSLIKLAAELRNPSWLSLDPSGRLLFATNDIGDFGSHSGAVSAFAVNRADGNLQLLNTVSLGRRGAGSPECRRVRQICFCRELRRRQYNGAAHIAHRSAWPSNGRTQGY